MKEKLVDSTQWTELAAKLQASVDAGEADAFWRLARLYEDGRGVPRDLERAFQLRVQGAELGEPNAAAWAGYCYEYAIGVSFNRNLAFQYYLKALTCGVKFESFDLALSRMKVVPIVDMAANVRLSIDNTGEKPRYIFRIAGRPRYEESFLHALMENTANNKSGLWRLELAAYLLRFGSPKKLARQAADKLTTDAIALFRKEYELGNGVAAGRLGAAYELGNGVEIDHEVARSLLEFAVDAGDPFAKVFMGTLLEKDGRLEEALTLYHEAAELYWADGFYNAGRLEASYRHDLERANSFFERGAKLGHAQSMIRYADACWESEDEETCRLAPRFWRDAADQGLALAQRKCALYLWAKGTNEHSDSEALWSEVARFSRLAAEQGDGIGKIMYADALYKGKGVAQNEKKATKLIKEVIATGDAESKEYLARQMFNADDDPELALKLLEEAAEERSSAQLELGSRYFSGDGVERDFRRAVDLFGKAACADERVAYCFLARCFEDGLGVSRNALVAEYFWRVAAGKGEAFAAYRVGSFYAEGEIAPQHWGWAFHWFDFAGKHGCGEALQSLALCFWNGYGVERDRDTAEQIWELAGTLGNDEAWEELARAKSAALVEDLLMSDDESSERFANKLRLTKVGSTTSSEVDENVVASRLDATNELKSVATDKLQSKFKKSSK